MTTLMERLEALAAGAVKGGPVTGADGIKSLARAVAVDAATMAIGMALEQSKPSKTRERLRALLAQLQDGRHE